MTERVQAAVTSERRPSFIPTGTSLLQRKCACGGTPGFDGECAKCRRKQLLGSQWNYFDQADQSEVPPVVHDVLRSPGRPLDTSTRASMQASFGHDFSQVRIHSDAKAEESARVIDAQAYTLGNSVVFGTGQYAPQTGAGRQLLAHELAHTLQQGAAPTHVPDRLMVGEAGSQLENEADSAAMAVRQGVSVASPRSSVPTPMVQRQGSTVSVDIEEATPEEAERLRRQGVQLPKVSAVTSDPRTHSHYVDQRIQAIGYGIYLGGYLLYCEGLELPVLVPERFVDLGLTNATSVNNAVYSDYDSARTSIPYGPWGEKEAVPYAYYRAAGGALPLIVPTIFSPATTPRTVETMLGARRKLAETVQRELTAVAIGLLGGMALRAVFSVIARVAGGRAPSGGKVPPETAPPARGPVPPRRPTPESQRPPAPATEPAPAPAARGRPAAPTSARAEPVATAPLSGAAPTGAAADYGRALGQRVAAAPGRRIGPIVDDLNAQTTMSQGDKAVAAQVAANSQGSTFGAGPIVRMPNGDLVVTPRAPGPNAPVLVVRPNGAVVTGNAEVRLNVAANQVEVTNVRVGP